MSELDKLDEKAIEKSIEQLPAIIKEFSTSPLGILSLMISALSALGYFFFKDSPEWVRIGIYVMLFSGVAMFSVPVLRRYLSDPKKQKPKQTPRPKRLAAPKLPDTYINWLTGCCAYMELERLQEPGQALRVDLPKIFTPLYAHDPKRNRETKKDEPGKSEPVDVETIIANNDYILIEGEAGSGKTTLLRHLAHRLIDKTDLIDKNKKISGIEGLKNYIPFLILLKDLRTFFENGKAVDETISAEEILSGYLKKIDDALDLDLLTRFVEKGNVLFLIDGLDEISEDQRNIVVNAFHNYMAKHPGNRFVLSGRPHGIEGAAMEKFGANKITIMSLSMEHVELFIKKWFAFVHSKDAAVGKKDAQSMIHEIREHPATGKLIDNPLMLTAICILYYDGKELPGQRAELYKKFVRNILHRRFDDPEKIYEFLTKLAFEMHEKRVRGADRVFAVDILGSVSKMKKGEGEKKFRKRMDRLFDEIEPKCGLLKYDSGQHIFMHLTFQEFLAALYLVENSTDYGKAIAARWDGDWNREMIQMYIGYLSIENKRWANTIVERAISGDDASPYRRWMIASKSFSDIHADRRDDAVLGKIQSRLIEIIDTEPDARNRATAGETLGWLGDTRADLRDFVKIDGGVYELEDEDGGSKKHEIKDFEIGKYPVVNSWFEEFVEDGGYFKKEVWSPEGWKWREYTKAAKPLYWDDRKWKCPNSPVVGVSWYEAFAFAQWLTLSRGDGYVYRLLTENEWQAAAAGHHQREYPWGKGWDKNRCNNKEINIGKTTPAGIFKDGQTPEGAFDLSGNVWEWTLSDYHSRKEMNDFVFDRELQKLVDENQFSEYFEKRDEKNRQLPVLRGGAWFVGSDFCLCARRLVSHPDGWDDGVGFRCLRT